jgi:hypothetical protein
VPNASAHAWAAGAARTITASLLVTLVALAGCSPPSPLAVSEPTLQGTEVLVPFASPVPGVTTQLANNNLDVVWHEGRLFLAFRTGPSHFASDRIELYVVSSADGGQTFELELRLDLDTDLREPRFLSLGGRLWLYFAVLGSTPTKFEPQGTRLVERLGPASWTAPSPWAGPVGEGDAETADFIPWRMHVEGGEAFMIGYSGGGAIYELEGEPEPIRVQWWKSTDGERWDPAVPGQPTVQVGGGSETDYALTDDGALIAVTRNELGDAQFGWGSKICRAEPGALGDWRCVPDKRKFDSPLVFRAGGQVWLVARRHLTETGHYDLGEPEATHRDTTLKYLVEYSFQGKVCSLWRVDPSSLAVTWALDLPSQGDTCFPSVLPASPEGPTRGDLGAGPLHLYNYTSPLTQHPESQSWLDGQGGPTSIVRHSLLVPPPTP